MSRRFAREQVFKLLFQLDFAPKEQYQEQIELFFSENIENKEVDQDFIREEIKGVQLHLIEIDEKINKYSQGWKTSRMPKVDLAILRLAVYEIFYVEEIPINVSINEAVELAKKFSGESSPIFINGILGKIIESQS